jgi:hypothetical protein
MRPHFLGHILVELLLDAALIAEDPRGVDAYYRALAAVDARRVAEAVGRMNGADASPLVEIIERFLAMRFLYDYVEDEPLAYRLNQVMRRVRLPELPARFIEILPDARRLAVYWRDELLTPPAVAAEAAEPLALQAP